MRPPIQPLPDHAGMSIDAHAPRELRLRPFRGSVVIAAGLLTSSQLRGRAWRRLFPDVYISADSEMNHLRWCEAAVIYAGGHDRATISGRSAAYLMGVDLLPLGDPPVILTVPSTSHCRSRDHLDIPGPSPRWTSIPPTAFS